MNLILLDQCSEEENKGEGTNLHLLQSDAEKKRSMLKTPSAGKILKVQSSGTDNSESDMIRTEI